MSSKTAEGYWMLGATDSAGYRRRVTRLDYARAVNTGADLVPCTIVTPDGDNFPGWVTTDHVTETFR